MRIGLFGGTFDPIHKGHLRIAKKAFKYLNLHRIYFIPAKQNPLKKRIPASPFHRMGMLAIALRNINNFLICDYELRSDKPSYTYNTVKYFKTIFKNDDLYLIVGMDNVKDFDKWYRFNDILKICTLVLFGRGIKDFICKYPHVFINANLPYSSTKIRDYLKKSIDIQSFLSRDVYRYIKKHSLYKKEDN